MRLNYAKTVGACLLDQLNAAGFPYATTTLESMATQCWVTVPDGTNRAAVDAVVAAHNPAQCAAMMPTPRLDALEFWRDQEAKPAIAALQAARPRTATKTVTSLLLTAPVPDTLTWDTPFANANYKATASVVGGTAATTATVRITGKTAAGITVSVTGGLLGGTAIIDAIGVAG